MSRTPSRKQPPSPTRVKIAEFKTRLGRYLGMVRAGESITVLDRDHPVAVVSPFRQAGEMPSRPATRPFADVLRNRFEPVAGVDPVADLLADRKKGRH